MQVNIKMAPSSKPKVLVTRGDHDPGAIQRLAEYCEVEVCPEPRAYTRAELLKRVEGKDALLILPHDKINEELVNAAGPQLKVIGTHSVGHDHIDQILMKKKKSFAVLTMIFSRANFVRFLFHKCCTRLRCLFKFGTIDPNLWTKPPTTCKREICDTKSDFTVKLPIFLSKRG